MSKRIILGDNQVIFRTGVARVLRSQHDMEIVAQCDDAVRLREAVGRLPYAVVVFPSSLTSNLHDMLDQVEKADSRAVLILEHGAPLDDSIAQRASGVVLRSVGGDQLLDCLRRVAAGERCVPRGQIVTMPQVDRVGRRVLERLTPKEIQIIALVAEGWKNRQIAERLTTKEQVVKNYLRSIYDKTGVSDRLELTVYTVHHSALAEATAHARAGLVRVAQAV